MCSSVLSDDRARRMDNEEESQIQHRHLGMREVEV